MEVFSGCFSQNVGCSSKFIFCKNVDCKLSHSYSDKLKGVKKIDKTYAVYDDGSCDTNIVDKETYDEWYNSDQIKPSWDELNF